MTKKKKLLISLCIVLAITVSSCVGFLVFTLVKKSKTTEQTQVTQLINKLNKKLAKDSTYLDYGFISFDNRDNINSKDELDVSSLTYKKPILGYIFVDYVAINNPKLIHFSESLIYTKSTERKKQITNYVFYFEDSEVSGTRYYSNYTYNESNNGIENYNITYDIKYDEKFIKNANYLNNIINVKDYYDESLKKDGKEYDWTVPIKKACDDLNKFGGLLYFPCDTYHVNVTKDAPVVLNLESEHNIIVDFCNSKLVLENNNLGQYQMILLKNCENVTIKNGTLQGDRMLHDYSDPGFGQFRTTHEGGAGIYARATDNATIYNMEIYDFTGDAVCLSNTSGMEKNNERKYVYVGKPTTINIDKCVLHHCRRQGVSVLDCKSFNITNTEIYSIGQFSWAYEEDCTSDELKDTVVKGTAPSAGIDFEPDRYTFLVENALVENCYIHNTDNFAMVNTTVAQELKDKGYLTTTPNLIIRNTLASSNPCLAGENINEGEVFRQAIIDNSTFVYDRLLSWSGYDENGNLKQNGAVGFNRVKFVNSKIIKTHLGDISIWTEDCEFVNCLFEQNKNTIDSTVGVRNGLVSFARAKLVNNTFNNLVGDSQNGPYYYNHGVVFMTSSENGGGIADGSTGNIFNNSSVFFRLSVNIFNNEEDKDKIHFNNCRIFAYPSDVDTATFKNVNFKDCETKANNGLSLVFENCNFYNSGAFYHYNRTFKNCYIELEELNETLIYTDANGNSYGHTPFGGSSPGDSKSPYLYNTTIVVKNNMSHSTYDIRAFRNSYFYDNCIIILSSKYESKKVILKDHEDRSVTIKFE